MNKWGNISDPVSLKKSIKYMPEGIITYRRYRLFRPAIALTQC